LHRIDSSGAAVALPTPAAAGTPGYWTGGNPASGIPATILDQDWLNSVQEELLAILTAGGVTPSKTTRNQVLTALQALFPGLAAAGRSVATPGYLKLPGGLILQWCFNLTTTTDGAGQMNYLWTYPVAFPSAPYAVSLMPTFIGTQTNTPQITLNGASATQAFVVGKGFPTSATAAVSGFAIGA